MPDYGAEIRPSRLNAMATNGDADNRKSLRRRSVAYLGDLVRRSRSAQDDQYRQAILDGTSNLRAWYSSFTTIDWLHDAVREDARRAKLRQKRGLSGSIALQWDRLQGWVLITLTGLLTAFIAFGIIRLESFLFSAKEGYCRKHWLASKRACPHHQWQEWGTLLDGDGSVVVQWLLEYGIYIISAIAFATLASVLTIYLSASDSVVSRQEVLNMPAAPSLDQTVPSPRSPRIASTNRVSSYVSFAAVDFDQGGHRRGRSQVRQASVGSTPNGTPRLPEHSLSAPASRVHSRRNSNVHFDAADDAKQATDAPQVLPRKTMYFAGGSGIPEIKTILGGFVIRGYLGGWTLFAKALGLCLSCGSGLSLGKEGPFVHIASCVGNILSRFFPKFDQNEAKRREVLSAACAAGVAVSFGAPVGGVLFSLEETSAYFPPKVLFRSFVCAMIAATTLKFLDPFGSGKIVLFEVTYDKDWHFAELGLFAVLGIAGGAYGALFNKANVAWTKYVRNGTQLRSHPVFEVAAVCAITACLSFFNRFTKLGGTELVLQMFSECSTDDTLSGLCVSRPHQVPEIVSLIALALLAKVGLTVITFGIRCPAGIFIPTLAVGACFGRIMGLAIEYAYAHHPESALFGFCSASGAQPAQFGQACVLPGVYAMVGATATLAGVTRTTVSLAVIMFELTGTLTYVVPVMVGVLFSVTVANAIDGRSIYDLVINANQLPYLDAKEDHAFEGNTMDAVDVDAPFISLDDDNTISSLTQLLNVNAGCVSGFPILRNDAGPRLVGYLGYDDLQRALTVYQQTLQNMPPRTPCTFNNVDDEVDFKVDGEEQREEDQSLHTSGKLDLGHLTDQAPIAVSSRAPMQLLHQLFIKLGVRYVAVHDQRGVYVGIIDKNRWLGYLKWMEDREESHGGIRL